MTGNRERRWPPLALLAVLAMLACSSRSPAPQVHQVAIRGMQFEPAALVVAVGDEVVWTNEDVVPHTATAPGVFDSKLIESKQQWRYTVTSAGTFAYTCALHPPMTATLTAR